MRIKKIISDLLPFVFAENNARHIADSLALTTVEIGLNLLTPLLLSKTISSLTAQKSDNVFGNEISPMVLTTLYCLSWAFAQLLVIMRNLLINPVGQQASRKLQEHYLQYVMNQSLQYHHSVHESDHDFRLNKCYSSMPEVCTKFFSHILPTTIEILIAVSVLCGWYGWQIGIGLAVTLLIYTGYSFAISDKIKKLREECTTTEYDSYYVMKEAINCYETVHLFNQMPRTLQRIDQKLRLAMKKRIDSDACIAKINLLQILITAIGFMSLHLVASDDVLQNRQTVNNFIVISAYLAQFATPLAAFGASINQLLSALIELESFFEEMKQLPEIVVDHSVATLQVSPVTAKVEFKGVSFKYPNNGDAPPHLDNVSFTIIPGQTLGIVGESGSGKSTIANLLYRFMDPTSGTISINDQDIRAVELNSLRSAIAIVPQAPVLFNDTIYNNIAFGGSCRKEEISKQEVETAANIACLQPCIESLSKGFDTVVGERGAKLSGGQKQRLAIARALLKEPSIFIFDEATSALDSKTEKEVQENIDSIANDVTKTAIIITHHLRNTVNANYIVVLDKGRIIEQGTHQELLILNGKYAQLWRIQNEHTVSHDSVEDITDRPTPDVTQTISPNHFFFPEFPRTTGRSEYEAPVQNAY